MPRPPALRKKRSAATACACPRSRARRPPPDRWFEPQAPTGSNREPPDEKPVFPVYAGPLEPLSGGRELSGAPASGKRARRQSRTGHGRTRREGSPPVSSGLSTALASTLPQKGLDKAQRKPLMIIRGRIAPPTPAGCLAGSSAPAKRLDEIFVAPRRTLGMGGSHSFTLDKRIEAAPPQTNFRRLRRKSALDLFSPPQNTRRPWGKCGLAPSPPEWSR